MFKPLLVLKYEERKTKCTWISESPQISFNKSSTSSSCFLLQREGTIAEIYCYKNNFADVSKIAIPTN